MRKKLFCTLVLCLFILLATNSIHPFMLLAYADDHVTDVTPGGLGALQSPNGKYPHAKLPFTVMASSLPHSVDLSGDLPPVGNQGQTGTCTAWAVSYYYKTFQQKREHGYSLIDNSGKPLYDRIFSPNFIYNQINHGTSTRSCEEGSYIGDALALLAGQGTHLSDGYGDLPWEQFPWNSSDCSLLPTQAQKDQAFVYRSSSYGSIFQNNWQWDKDTHPTGAPFDNDLSRIKAHLANGDPVIFNIPVYNEFDSAYCDDSVATPRNYNTYRGLHAVLAVGYDDSYATSGAFKIVNSWGSSWACAGFANLSYAFIRQYLIEAWVMFDRPDYAPIQPDQDSSTFTGIESPADNTIVAPSQPIHKTWRVKNTGNRIWGPDHKLVFIGGNQMGAPNAVNIPLTEPGGVADISIDITAPGTSGTHRGEWRLRNPQGTFFGDKLWVQIVVPETNNPQPPNASTMQLTCTNCPASVAPGQSFRPTIRVTGSVPLLQSRGDMLRNTDGNRYGAYEFVAVNGAVNQGQSYDFTFYEQNPITAPNTEGVYESKWRIWQNGGWVGSEYTIRFEVKAGLKVRRHPIVAGSPAIVGHQRGWVTMAFSGE
jgi:hypothetical protein